jgi:hypothetical protein
MKRKEIAAKTIKQDNDAGCMNPRANDQKGSQHNKKAKRLASKRLRRVLKEEQTKAEKDL